MHCFIQIIKKTHRLCSFSLFSLNLFVQCHPICHFLIIPLFFVIIHPITSYLSFDYEADLTNLDKVFVISVVFIFFPFFKIIFFSLR